MTLEQQYIQHLENCFEKAARKESKLIQDIHDIPGMTGELTRHFYNNLLSMDGARYLEIGCWQGSSTCSAMYGNESLMIVIDDFSGFGGPKEEFLKNAGKYTGRNVVAFKEIDCFKLDIKKEGFSDYFNIYLFDGDHSEQSQFKSIDYYLPAMQDIFIFIADDANWPAVRQGTQRAIEKNNLEVLWKKEILTTNDDSFPPDDVAKSTWWNGIQVYLLKKQIQ